MKATLVVALLLVAVCVSAQEKLVFFDDFNTFDMSVWKHELTMGGGGNWEFEMYVNNRSTTYVENSILYIKPQLTSSVIGQANVMNGFTYDFWGNTPADLCTGNAFYGCFRQSNGANIINPIQSARVRTAESFFFRYGRVEVRAKLPRGDWLWPAIWMLPRYNMYGNWPASGEIDIMEARGNLNYPDCGLNCFSSTLHFGPYWAVDGYMKAHSTYTLPSGDFSQDFHIFGLQWSNTSMTIYLDTPSQVVLNVPITQSFWQLGGWQNEFSNPWNNAAINAPFDQQFYLIMNLAVGGVSGFFPDGMGGKPWSDSSNVAASQFYAAQGQWYPTWQDGSMQIDWVKVWQDQSDIGQPQSTIINL